MPDLLELELELLENMRYSAISDEQANESGAMAGAAREANSSCTQSPAFVIVLSRVALFVVTLETRPGVAVRKIRTQLNHKT